MGRASAKTKSLAYPGADLAKRESGLALAQK